VGDYLQLKHSLWNTVIITKMNKRVFHLVHNKSAPGFSPFVKMEKTHLPSESSIWSLLANSFHIVGRVIQLKKFVYEVANYLCYSCRKCQKEQTKTRGSETV